jgi:ParB-like chromosome segregation protein Spo0J
MNDQPIDNITWRDAQTLHANHWNPNRVMTTELLLLERSLLTLGWIQPILANTGGTIIDGFHRWRIAQDSPKVVKRFSRLVPVATLDVDEPTAMAITVRINRAKGVHTGQGMSELCRTIVNVYGWTVEQLGKEIGADEVEMAHLMLADVFEMKKTAAHGYSPSWYPTGTPADMREGFPDGRDDPDR